MLTKKEEPNGSQVDDLFGPPPLLRGEDKDRYWRLHAAIDYDVKPVTLFDRIYVREMTDKLWQQQRCRQSAASIVEAAYINALASLLRPFNPPNSITDEFATLMAGSRGDDVATTMARDYYGGEAKPNRVAEVKSCLATHGISQEQIRAKAMQLCGSDISLFNRMESNCETSLRMLRKEQVRRHEGENAELPVAEGGE
jgi:hypothetical protein